jgi:hypothetical protein
LQTHFDLLPIIPIACGKDDRPLRATRFHASFPYLRISGQINATAPTTNSADNLPPDLIAVFPPGKHGNRPQLNFGGTKTAGETM